MEHELTSDLKPQLSINARDIDDSQLQTLRKLTPFPDCLDELVNRARNSLGFFTKHATRSIEYPWVVSILERYQVKKVLDIGAGVSVLPIRFSDRGMSVITVDYSDMVRTQKTQANWTEWGFLDYSIFNPGIRSFNSELSSIKIDGSVDACYSVSVLEHMPKAARQSMIKNAAHFVKSGGLMVLTLDLIPKGYKLWNRDRGKIVEEPTLHGDLHAFIEDAYQENWMLEQLEIVRGIPGSVTDVALCIFRLDGKTPSLESKPQHPESKSQPAAPGRLKESFTKVFLNRGWSGGGEETVSGAGSTLSYTSTLRSVLESYLIENRIQSILDAPCGDFNWFKEMQLHGLDYIGMDIVDELIHNNLLKYGSDKRKFLVGDITRDPLPHVDIMLCRDCLMHLPFANCLDFFKNFLNSGIENLLLTSHLNNENSDLSRVAGFRQINFQRPPFNFPKPSVVMKDFQPGFPGREVCLWTASEIRLALKNI